jgi:TatD DNase family protein
MGHPRCVGWGEVGLDYHSDHSPRDVQQRDFAHQPQQATRLDKPITFHTREADNDTERILKDNVPKDHKVRCLTTVKFLPDIHNVLEQP